MHDPRHDDTARLDALVREFADIHALEAALHARKLRVLSSAMTLADDRTARLGSRESAAREMPLRAIAAELAVAVRASDRSLQGQMADAAAMCARFPATVAALDEGHISRAHADILLDAGAELDDTVRGAFERTVLDRAERVSPGRLRPFARGLAEQLHPRPLDERHAELTARRRVQVTDLGDGMSELLALLPTALAHGIHDRLTRQARAIAAVARPGAPESLDAGDLGDVRTTDQTRADLFADLLLTGAPRIDPTLDVEPGGLGAIRASVQISVPALVLAGIEPGAGELDGRSPVDPETARRLAGRAPGWDRVLTHPVTGAVLAVDRYRPSEDLRRRLRARDRHCRFPGCRMPARRCDIDHTHDAALGGATELGNLAHFCRRHHSLKHATDWAVRQLPGGSLEWTTPTGRRYRDDPPTGPVFVPDLDPPDVPPPPPDPSRPPTLPARRLAPPHPFVAVPMRGQSDIRPTPVPATVGAS